MEVLYSKFFKGEDEAPRELDQKGQFFWMYEHAFYKHHNARRNPSKEEFDAWLDNLLRDYLPNKMACGPINEEEAYREWKHDYETTKSLDEIRNQRP